ncbi:SDR family oxidoreductase, partial [Streptomyces milbemycinicus]|uniref:SDR family oxidoreductase n=1 Tax=Streptomyces milbemycinicus TaxID=476552 RepID=UPI000A35F4B2
PRFLDGADDLLGGLGAARVVEHHLGAVEEAGGIARAVRLDLAEPGAAEQLMETASQGPSGGVEILVNNAAVNLPRAPLAEIEEERFDHLLSVNLKAAFLTVRYAARHMPDGGRIINISTLNTVRAVPGVAPYMISKGALEQLTAAAAQELGERGITVNTVSPGATDTDMLHDANPGDVLDLIVSITPLRRLGQPSDVADVVAFLAGPDGRWLTGQNLRASGGLS